MTRCREFYEKLEKDGNFCGMGDRSYTNAQKYWKEYRSKAQDNGKNLPLSEEEWFKDKRKEAKRFKEVEPEKPKPKTLKQYDFAKEVNNAVIYWLTLRDEETIREVVDKALVNNRGE